VRSGVVVDGGVLGSKLQRRLSARRPHRTHDKRARARLRPSAVLARATTIMAAADVPSYLSVIEAKRRETNSALAPFLAPASSIAAFDNVVDVRNAAAIGNILSPSELAITRLEGVEIVDQVSSQRVSCVDVASAFIKSAVLAHQLV
jgi:hypothetical protein